MLRKKSRKLDNIMITILITITLLVITGLIVNHKLDDPMNLEKPKDPQKSMKDKHHRTLMLEGVTHVVQHFHSADEMIQKYQNIPKGTKHVHEIISLEGVVDIIAAKNPKDEKSKPIMMIVNNSKEFFIKCHIDNDSEFKLPEFKQGDYVFVMGIACDKRHKNHKLLEIHIFNSMIDHKYPRHY